MRLPKSTLPPPLFVFCLLDNYINPGSCSLLESGSFSDAVVVCQGKEWSVHKAIICRRSVWFEGCLDGPFKVC